MIVPIKCFGCGKQIANIYRLYLDKVKEKKLSKNKDPSRITYLTSDPMEISPEKEVMDALRINKMCCRNLVLTVVEI